MFNDISQSSWIIIASFLVGIFGIFRAIIIYFKNKRIKKLSYSIRSFNLISNSISTLPGFSVTFKNNIINNLTAEKILLWNSGSDIISSGDIANTDPLRISYPPDVNILDVRVSSVLNPTNVLSTELNSDKKNIITITFEYIAAKEGCLISILYDGKTKEKAEVLGTIKGAGLPMKFKKPKWLEPTRSIVGIILVILMFLSVFIGESMNFPIWITFVMVFFIGAMIFFTIALFQKFERRKTGKNIDQKFDDAFSPSDFS